MTSQIKPNTNGRRWVFSEATFKKINLALGQLCLHLKADVTIFADRNGYPISYEVANSDIDINNLTVLAAGTFSATAEMASLVKEKGQFKYIFHEGNYRNIYMCTVSTDYLMVIVFKKQTALGLVRVLAQNVVTRLEELVDVLKKENRQAVHVLDEEFKSLLNKELDKTFGF